MQKFYSILLMLCVLIMAVCSVGYAQDNAYYELEKRAVTGDKYAKYWMTYLDENGKYMIEDVARTNNWHAKRHLNLVLMHILGEGVTDAYVNEYANMFFRNSFGENVGWNYNDRFRLIIRKAKPW